MKRILLTISFAFVFFAQTIFGCTLAGKPLSDFDATEYIFIGEVVGYAQPLESAKLHGKAHGLIVKVRESVSLPKAPKTHFEIFPIALWVDCSLGGINLEELKKFPIGSEIRVVAKEAEILPNNLPDGNIRLEDRPDELGSLALNTDEKGKRMSSANSVFDYKSFKYDMNEDSIAKYFLPNFEIRKDLLRLKKSREQTERDEILKRLADVPICCNDLNMRTVLKTYTANEAEFNRRYEMHLRKRLTEEEFAYYKAVNETQSELVRLGFKMEDAEKAVGQALKEGTEISKAKLLERSLQILREKKSN